jgi:hypothetical protein
VDEIRLTGASHLPLMLLLRELERALDVCKIVLRAVLPDLRFQLSIELLYRV